MRRGLAGRRTDDGRRIALSSVFRRPSRTRKGFPLRCTSVLVKHMLHSRRSLPAGLKASAEAVPVRSITDASSLTVRRPKGLGWHYEAHRRGLDMCSINLTTTS